MTLTSTTIPNITQHQVAAYLTKRPKDSHKGMFGTVAVIGGASGMVGAALLAGRAALKTGAGCVHVGLLADNAPSVDSVQPELMLHSASDIMSSAPFVLSPSPPFALSLSKERTGLRAGLSMGDPVLAVGCGLGTSLAARNLLETALQSNASLVLDADALNLLAAHPDLQSLLTARKTPTVLTPHPGEAARLLSSTTADIQKDRITSVQRLAKVFACSVVLKGAYSLCSTNDGLFVNETGNPGMSAPGMGDVLTGMIAAFLAQGLRADHALLLAVHLHGAAGDEMARLGISVGMTASELTDQARLILNRWVSRL